MNVLIFLLVLTSVLSPKAVKEVFNLNIPWVNPQYFFGLLIFIRMFFKDRFNRKYNLIYVVSAAVIVSYIMSSYISMLVNNNFYYKGLLTTIRISLDIIFVLFTIINFNTKEITYVLKSVILAAIFDVVLELYGILVWANLIPAGKQFALYVKEAIGRQQWVFIANKTLIVPKWGATFAETQALALLFLMAFISCYFIIELNKSGKIVLRSAKPYSYLRFVFAVLIVYHFSKAVLAALVLFIILMKVGRVSSVLKFIFRNFGAVASGLVVYLLLMKEIKEIQAIGVMNLGLETASSLSERMFHLVMGLKLISQNLMKLFTGLGPRQYGTLILSIFNNPRFNPDSNLISMFQILIDVGAIGAILFVLLMFVIYRYSRIRSIFSISFLVILMGNFTNPDNLSSIFWIFIAVILALSLKHIEWDNTFLLRDKHYGMNEQKMSFI